MSFDYDPMSGRQVHPLPSEWPRPSDALREWALRNGSRPGGWPAMPDPIAECPECGKDFTPEDPTCDEWCPACAGADRWDNA